MSTITTIERLKHHVGETVTLNDAEVVAPVVARRPGTRIRETVSLGYAGDGKLTES